MPRADAPALDHLPQDSLLEKQLQQPFSPLSPLHPNAILNYLLLGANIMAFCGCFHFLGIIKAEKRD